MINRLLSTGSPGLTFGSTPEKSSRRSFLTQLLVAGSVLVAGAVGADTFTSVTGASKASRFNTNPAMTAFDQIVERYLNESPNGKEALERVQQNLARIDAKTMTPQYQGLHMLFDHHLQGRLFELNDGPSLMRMGVDLTKPKTELEERLLEHKRFGRPSPQLMEGGIGKRRYDAILNIDNFVNLDSDGLTRLAKQRYDAIEAEMKQIAKRIDPSKDWRAIYMDLRKEHPKQEDLMGVYRKEVERARQFLKDKNLISLPKEQLEVIETPDWYRGRIPYAAYLPGRGPSGQFMVTTVIDTDPAKAEEQLRAHSYGFIPPVVVHEAMPGHHTQHVHDSYNRVDQTNPSKRTLAAILEMTDRNTYFLEGWGVYSEEMVRENGYYTKPQEELFALRNILWRAARAWIDPQIHTGKMKYNEAVDFMVNNVLLERDRAEIEVNRYYQQPTVVSSYMVGMLQIQQLRAQLKAAQGNGFNLKNFHDSLLKGHEIPVPVIARMQFDQDLLLPRVP
jgi:hypothetical protein